MTLENLQISVPVPDGLLAALIIDDDSEYRKAIDRRLQREGFRVDQAASPSEAEPLLDRRKYGLVLCDNIIGEVDSPRELGSEFLVEKWQKLAGAEVALSSGFAEEKVVQREVLRERSVDFLRKGSAQHSEDIDRLVDRAKKRRIERVEEDLRALCSAAMRDGNVGVVDIQAGVALAKHAAQHLERYLERLPRQDARHLVVAGRLLSPRELRREVADGSSTGIHLIELLVDEAMNRDEI